MRFSIPWNWAAARPDQSGIEPSGGAVSLPPNPLLGPSEASLEGGGSDEAPPRGWRKGWLLGIWIFLGLMSAGPTYLHYLAEQQPIPWSRLISEVAGWYLWIVLFPVIIWAARRFSLQRQRWPRNLALHIGIGLLVAVLYALLMLVKNQVIFYVVTGDPGPHLLGLMPGYLFGGFQVYFLVYWMLIAAVHAVDYYRMYRERELRAFELEARLSRAHLQVLKMQLDPHFLFNTLNAISALLYSKPETADRMLGFLSDFLRLTLKSSNQQEVALAKELEFLEQYLEIEKTRFADRLRVNLDIDRDVMDAAVPSLVLQPLVENSIRHGMDNNSKTLEVSVRARRVTAQRLEIEVSDTGTGFPEPVEVAFTHGIGLSNTLARLKKLYGEDQFVLLRNKETGGAEVKVSIPLRRISEHEAIEVDSQEELE